MASDKSMPVPFQLVSDFKMLVEKFQRDHERVSNSTPYDENERWSWLNFLGGVYATGWNDGRSVQSYLASWQKPTPPAPAATARATSPTAGEMDTLLDEVARFAGEGAADLVRERIRQIHGEGYTQEHDAGQSWRSLAAAAATYALLGADRGDKIGDNLWPFNTPIKGKSMRRNLERAGALIAAALDRNAEDGA